MSVSSSRWLSLRGRRMLLLLSGLLALSLVLAACETDDDDAAVDEPDDEPDEPAEEPDDEPAEEPDEEADFSGETVEIIVPFSEGGGTDTIARLISPYLGAALPGEPAVQVVNVTGGGGLTGSNEFALTREADGTNLLMSADSTHFPYLLGDPAVEYDLADFVATVGFPEGAIMYVSPTTGIEEPADLADPDEPLVYGGIGATATDLSPLVAFELLGLDVQAVLGYDGRSAARVAFEQGETNIDLQFTSAYVGAVEPLIEAGEAIPLFSMGQMEDGELVRDPAHPDLPTVGEVYEELHGEEPSGEAWEAYQSLALSGYTIQKVLWVHDDAPPERIEALRQAGEQLAADDELQEDGAEVFQGYEQITGDELESQVDAVLDAPDDVIQWLRDFLVEEYDVERLAD